MAATVCLVSSYSADVHPMHLTRVLSVERTLSVDVFTPNPKCLRIADANVVSDVSISLSPSQWACLHDARLTIVAIYVKANLIGELKVTCVHRPIGEIVLKSVVAREKMGSIYAPKVDSKWGIRLEPRKQNDTSLLWRNLLHCGVMHRDILALLPRYICGDLSRHAACSIV